MPFNYEHEMVKPAERWLRSEGLLVKREFPLPWGICDLVGCSFNKKNVKKRLALGQKKPIGSQLRVFLLSMIPDREEVNSITLQRLHHPLAGFIDQARIEIELERLQRDRFVVQTPRGAFQRVNGWLPLHKKLVAVELKLSRIEDALCQAVNNLGFADESYVGLPVAVATRLVKGHKRREFEERSVGILAVSPSGCKVVLKSASARAKPDEVTQTHCVERFWQSYLKGTEA